MTISSVGQKIISFVYFTIIARSIGAENTGKYFFAMSFATIFVVFVDLGLTSVLVRESAKAKDKIQNYFSTVLWTKVILGVLTYLSAIVVINLMGYSVETKHLVYLSCVTMLFDSLHLSIYGILRVYGNLRYEAIGAISSQFITMVLGTIFLYARLPLIFLIAAFTIPSFLNVCYAGVILFKKYTIRLRPRLDSATLRFVVAIAIPFALTSIFTRVYGYIDSVLLSKLAGDAAVGWYSIPYKITFAFQFIPFALTASLFPRFSEYFLFDKQKLARVFEQAMKYLMIVVLPLAVGVSVLARELVINIFTAQFTNSILPLQILMFSLIFTFLSAPVSTMLNACNRQITQTVIIGIVMIINIVINLILIPQWGVVGAASAALVGNFLIVGLGYGFLSKITKISHSYLLQTMFRLMLAAGIMGLGVWWVNQLSNFVLAILAGAVIYPVSVFVIRAIKKEELRNLLLIIRN